MKNILNIIMAVALLAVCPDIYAAGEKIEDSPAAKVLESGKKTRRIEGATLKIVRPIIRKTPMSAVLDDIDMMMMCPVEKNNKASGGEFEKRVKDVLNGYMLAHEIDDELSHMLIYVDDVKDNRFSEIILYITSPDKSILLFKGDFTVESLKKVGELSEQDRKRRIKEKREKGKDDSYLLHLK